MKYKRSLALLLAALILALFAGCAPEEEYEYEEPAVTLENNGEPAQLTVAWWDVSGEYREALSEIIGKYRADFPQTEITLAECSSEDEAAGLLRSGGADIVQVSGSRQAALMDEGLLWDFYPYIKVWKEGTVLNNLAAQASQSLGDKQVYLLPADFDQEVLFYRLDWFEGFNAPIEQEEDQIACKTWGQLCNIPRRLGDQARLALAGKDHLGYYFDSILWSRAGRESMRGPSAAYFTHDEDGEVTTLFDTEAGLDAAHRFEIVMREAAVPGCEDWGIEEAVDAFINGEAGFLLADSSYYPALIEALPEGALGVEGYTRTDNGKCVAPLEFWGWSIGAKSAYKETAVHFLTYLSNADNNTHLAKVTGAMPIHREALLMEPSFAEGQRAAEMRMNQLSVEYQYACRPDMYVEASRDFPALYEGLLREYLSGGVRDEELLSRLHEFWMEAYGSQPDNWSPKKEEEQEEDG